MRYKITLESNIMIFCQDKDQNLPEQNFLSSSGIPFIFKHLCQLPRSFYWLWEGQEWGYSLTVFY